MWTTNQMESVERVKSILYANAMQVTSYRTLTIFVLHREYRSESPNISFVN